MFNFLKNTLIFRADFTFIQSFCKYDLISTQIFEITKLNKHFCILKYIINDVKKCPWTHHFYLCKVVTFCLMFSISFEKQKQKNCSECGAIILQYDVTLLQPMCTFLSNN